MMPARPFSAGDAAASSSMVEMSPVVDHASHARRQRLLNVWADDLSMDELLTRLRGVGGVVFTVNPDHLYHLQYNPQFVRAYRSADIITVDSHYVRFALRVLGRRVEHHLPGSDIVPAFCERERANPETRIFLLGARPGVAQRAREAMNMKAGRELVVGAHGPSMNFVNDPAETEAVITLIKASGANVLLVGLGAPKQEIWIASVRDRLPQVRVMMGVGATIDYEAGVVKRAPRWLRALKLEWTYRVVTEPRRYLMRYVRSSRFVWWMLLDRLGRYKDPFGVAASPLPR
jgi:N-acetylglucosaminyldiphosphoundecaprenol N-acetyl-beta-D-mannosaminyltransferase